MGNSACPFNSQGDCSSDCMFWNNSRNNCFIRAVKEMNLEENDFLVEQRRLMQEWKSLQTLEAEFDLSSSKDNTFNWEYDGGIGSY